MLTISSNCRYCSHFPQFRRRENSMMMLAFPSWYGVDLRWSSFSPVLLHTRHIVPLFWALLLTFVPVPHTLQLISLAQPLQCSQSYSTQHYFIYRIHDVLQVRVCVCVCLSEVRINVITDYCIAASICHTASTNRRAVFTIFDLSDIKVSNGILQHSLKSIHSTHNMQM